jgi:hypothetical protein
MDNYISTEITIMFFSIVILTLVGIIVYKLFKKLLEAEERNKMFENDKRNKLIKIFIITIFSVIFISGIIGTIQVSKNITIFENSNWRRLYSQRNSIVEEVIRNELNPNVSRNNFMCQLSFKSPIVSAGGNEIGIYRYDYNTVAVFFYLQRGFLDGPSTVFVYKNNNAVISNIEKYIENDSYNNWKIEENWYRLFGRSVNEQYYEDNFYIK